ncbi:MAG TPA: DUF1844 domain-containing protein [Candidatus Goldiibacteriota bacterium]|nr:DUF1844 domain-containing protein [Candidatus Goldiibacteriota bacterium]
MENKEDNIDFINLILMLNQNAMISLGEAPRFVGGMKNANLPHARQTINMIKSIQEKSKGNLTPGETKLLFKILGELQSKYVKAAGLDKPGPVKSSKPSTDGLGKALDNMSNDDLAKLLSELEKHAGNK